jgi:acyl-CoA dehydrogenase
VISFQPTEEELSFIEVAKDVAMNKIRPVSRECEQNGEVNEQLIQEIQKLGLTYLEYPEHLEGLELPLISQVQILQALSYGDLGIVQGLKDGGDVSSFIRLYHSKVKSLTPLENFTASLIDEYNPFCRFISLTKSDQGYVLNGTTQPIRLAKFANHLVVYTLNEESQPIVLWLSSPVEWKVEEGDYRLGLLAAGISRITFNNVAIKEEQIIAVGDEAKEIIEKVRTRIRIIQAAKEVGIMEAALDYATEYTAGRKAFGQEIAKFQGVSFRIAHMAMKVRSANHLVWEAALKADQNHPYADFHSLRALYHTHQSLRYVTDSAVQLLGGHGYIQEFPVEKWMRDAEAQVMLYGREQFILSEAGEMLVDQVHKEGIYS